MTTLTTNRESSAERTAATASEPLFTFYFLLPPLPVADQAAGQ